MENRKNSYQDKETTLRDFYNTIFRQKKKVVVFFLLSLVLAIVYTLVKNDTYQSQAKILVKMGRESYDMIPTRESSRFLYSSRSQVSGIDTEIEILKNREIIEDVIDRIGNEKLAALLGGSSSGLFPAIKSIFTRKSNTEAGISADDSTESAFKQKGYLNFRDNLITYLNENIDISVARGSNVINISYQSGNPEFCYLVVSNLTDAFITRHIELHFSNSTFEFFDDQVFKSRDQLQMIEKKIVDIKNSLNISSLDDSREVVVHRMRDLNTEFDQVTMEKVAVNSLIVSMKRSLETIDGTGETTVTPVNPDLMADFRELQARERELLSKYSDDNIQVLEVRKQIQDAKALMSSGEKANQPTISVLNEQKLALQSEENKLVSLTAKQAELKKLITEAQNELKKLNEAELKIAELEREREIQQSNYMKYAENLEEARIDQIVQQQNLTNIKILQQPFYPQQPMPNRKFRNLALGIFAGLFGSIFLAIFLEFMDHSIKTEEDIEKRLQLPTLVVIPDAPKNKIPFSNKGVGATMSNNRRITNKKEA